MSGNATAAVTVEMAFGYRPLAVSPVWTPLATAATLGEEALVTESGEALVTESGEALVAMVSTSATKSRVRSLSTNLKIGDEGTCDLVLDNRDRALEPDYAGSPYWPNVVPNTRVRVLAGGWTIFDGYIDSITPDYRLGPVGDAAVKVHCTDMTKLLARLTLRHPYEAEVAADAPIHWWPLGEAANAPTFADKGSQPESRPGTFIPGAQIGGAPVVRASQQTSVEATAVASATAPIRSPVPPWTVEVVCDGVQESKDKELFDVDAARFGPLLIFMGKAGGNITGGFRLEAGRGFFSYGDRVKLDQGPHVFAATFDGNTFKFFVNGSNFYTVFGGSGVSRGYTYAAADVRYPLNVMKVGGNLAANGPDVTTTAQVGQATIYDRVLSPARLLAHASAARAPWAGDSTGGRVERIISQVGLTPARYAIDPGITTGLAALEEPIDGKTALALARDAERTEMGKMYASRGGLWRFADRRNGDGVPVAMVVGDGGGTELPYTSAVPEFTEDSLVKEATVTRQGGNPQTYTDPDMHPEDAVFSVDVTGTLYGTDPEAFDAAAYRVTQGKTPKLRFKQVTLPASRSAALMAAVLARDTDQKVTVRRRPPGGGAPQEETAVIEGIAHDVDLQALTWFTTFALAPLDQTVYWLLEDNVAGLLDNTTVLAF